MMSRADVIMTAASFCLDRPERESKSGADRLLVNGNTRRERPSPSLAIMTRQISHYHAARYRAAARVVGQLSVIASMNDADFREFLGGDVSDIDVVRLFYGKKAYRRAVASGEVWSATGAALDTISPNVVVVAGWSSPESLAAIAWCRRVGARVVIMSDSQRHDGRRHPLREAVKARVVSACDTALVAAGPHKDYVVELGIPGEGVFFGYDAVDNDHFLVGAAAARDEAAAVRAKHALPTRYILSSARFISKKNLPRLVDAFARALLFSGDQHDLVILGNGPERPAIEAAIAASGLTGRVHLPGFRSYDVLPVYYGLADGFAHVAVSEQWGLVINEAAAAGLPLVVSRPCGAAAELIRPGENGFIVDPHDVEGIARALSAVMTATHQVRRSMGVVSRAIVAKWGPERFAQGLDSACQAALSMPPRRLASWDAVLFRALSQHYIAAVP